VLIRSVRNSHGMMARVWSAPSLRWTFSSLFQSDVVSSYYTRCRSFITCSSLRACLCTKGCV